MNAVTNGKRRAVTGHDSHGLIVLQGNKQDTKSLGTICETRKHARILFWFHYNTSLTNRSKGQLFIIAAVFMVIGLVILFGILSAPELVEEKNFQNTMMLAKNAKNILNEYKYAAGVATLNSPANESLFSYMTNLSDYYRRDSDSNIIFAAAVLNGSTQKFSVVIGNYLKDVIDMNISVTNATPASMQFVLTDKASRVVDFAGNTGVLINITLNYTVGNVRVVEKFPINSSSRNFMLLFSDIRLKDGDHEVRTKDTYNRTW